MTKQNAKKNTFKSCVEADPPNTQGTGSKKQDSIGKKKKKKKNKRSHKIVEVGSKKWMEQLIEEKVQEHAAAEAGAKKELTAPENSNNEVTGICHMCQQPFTREINFHGHFDNPLPDDSDQQPQLSTSSASGVNLVLVNDMICHICGFECLSKNALKAHLGRHLKGVFETAVRLNLIKSSKSVHHAVTERETVQCSSSSAE